MEYLDIYDENKNYLGKELRDIVHRDALWHNTVHCWLYDKNGNIYFQIRKNEGKLYTTASGHVMAGETVKQGFGREIEEEIGIKINYEEASLVNIYKFTMDKLKNDGTYFRDRAFSNVYVCEYKGNDLDFNFDENEINGLVKVNVNDVFNLFNGKNEKIQGTIIEKNCNNNNNLIIKDVVLDDFLVNKGETVIGKYGDILDKVLELIR